MAEESEVSQALAFLTSEMTAGFARLSGQLLHLEGLQALHIEGQNRIAIVQGAMQLGFEALGQRLDGMSQRLGALDGRLDGFDRRLGHLLRKWMEQGTSSLALVTAVSEEGRAIRLLVEKLEERCRGLAKEIEQLESKRDAG